MNALKKNAIIAATNNTIGWMHDINAWECDKLKCLESVTFINSTRWHIVDEFANYYDAGGYEVYGDELKTTEIDGILVNVISEYTEQAKKRQLPYMV